MPKVDVALRSNAMLPSEETRPVSFKYMEPVPVRSVPFTQRLEAMVDVPLSPFTSMKPAKVLVLVFETMRLVSVVVPEEIVPAVSAPSVANCEKRFVELAVVENRLVVVALVSAAEFAERTPRVAEVEYRFVELAVVA